MIEQNFKDVSAKLPKSAQLIAVSKKQPEDRIDTALKTGHRLYGENRVQEAYARWACRKEIYSDLALHLIGPLQTNKVKEAVALFDVIQTLDRPKLAAMLAKEMQKQSRILPVLIQVNTGEEEQKSGVMPADLDALYHYAVEECGLNATGLMCIPPANEPAGLHFALLKKLAKRYGLSDLSMGMSADYEAALKLGATYVRVGSALFGARDT